MTPMSTTGRDAVARVTRGALLLSIALGVWAMWRGVLRLNVSWDEFHYLSRIYEHQRSELLQRLQTLHVRCEVSRKRRIAAANGF